MIILRGFPSALVTKGYAAPRAGEEAAPADSVWRPARDKRDHTRPWWWRTNVGSGNGNGGNGRNGK